MYEIAAAVAVGVDVRDGVCAQFVGVLFGPFGRAEQARLFAVPRAIDDGALRLPALLEQFAERARFFEHGDHAGDRIFGAIHPGVVVIAADDPLVGKRRARNFRDHVVDGLDVPVGFHFQVNLRGAGADAIGDAEAAAPAVGSDAAGRARRAAAAHRRRKSAAREFL